MTEYEIKITGQGSKEDIIAGLTLIARAMEYNKERKILLDSPNVEDLDGSEWKDNTLLLEISKIRDLELYDTVEAAEKIKNIPQGSRGTIVHIWDREKESYVVEFFFGGRTIGVETVNKKQIRLKR